MHIIQAVANSGLDKDRFPTFKLQISELHGQQLVWEYVYSSVALGQC